MKKRKIFTVVLIFSILMATLAGCDKADKVSDTTKKPVIKIGSDNYPPYNFLNEDGIGSLRHGRAGEDAHCFAFTQSAGKSMASSRLADDGQD